MFGGSDVFSDEIHLQGQQMPHVFATLFPMKFTRFYPTRCLTVLILILSVGGILHFGLFPDFSEELLEDAALQQLKESGFDPKRLTMEVYDYIQRVTDKTETSHRGGKLDAMNQNLPRDSYSKHTSPDEDQLDHESFHQQNLQLATEPFYFHWDSFIDLSPGNIFLNHFRTKYPNGQCDSTLNKFASVNAYWIESYNTKLLRSLANAYCIKDIPSKIYVVTDDNMIEVPVAGKRRTSLKFNTPTKEELVAKMELLTNKDYIKSVFETHTFKPLQKSINVQPQDFLYDADAEIFKLQRKLNLDRISASELSHLKFLRYSKELVQYSDRYFKYPWIYSDIVVGRAKHLAYPFFTRYIGNSERRAVLQHLVRVWFQFAEINGFTSWINYGNLMGWAFNGVNLPWDTDIDIQMPILHLDRMAREFNNSFFIENPRFGNGKYLLEIAPTYTRHGNGRNFIDGRFIDVNSGLYIDLSALSHTEEYPHTKIPKIYNSLKTMTVHCKNWNWHSLRELLPIRHTYFDGGSVYIPHNVTRLMLLKYGSDSLTNFNFERHNFQQDISLWVPDDVCRAAPDGERFENGDFTLTGACNDIHLQDEYKIVEKCKDRHLRLNKDLDIPSDYEVEKEGDLPIVRKDPWDYYNDLITGKESKPFWYHEYSGKPHEKI